MFSQLTSFGEVKFKTKAFPDPKNFFIKTVEKENNCIIKQALNQKRRHIKNNMFRDCEDRKKSRFHLLEILKISNASPQVRGLESII